MIDTINLMLIKHRRVNLIQLKRRLQIIPEWLLNNNTRMRSIQPGRLQMQRHHPIQRRRSSQIEQQIIRIDLLRKLYQTLPQLRISLHFRRIHRQIIQMRHKRRHQLQILLFSLYKLLQLPKYIWTVIFIRIDSTPNSQNSKTPRQPFIPIQRVQCGH